MKKLIIAVAVAFLIPYQSFAKIPKPEYVSMNKIKEVCGLSAETLGCTNYKRILIYWKVQSIPLLAKKIYYHEVGHILTGKWQREEYLKKFGFADIPENNVISLSEKVADIYEDYKTVGIKDKKAIKVFQALEKLNR